MNELGLACAHVCRDPPYIVESFVGVAHTIIGDVQKKRNLTVQTTQHWNQQA